LLQSGFDEMETLHAMDDADMRELGIPPTDASRLRKGLQELRPGDKGIGTTESNPVLLFLQTFGLEQYSATLLGSGFDEIETLLDVDDADLRDLGIPRGHALKLKRHLREYQTGPPAEEEQPVVQAAVPRISQQPVVQATAPPRICRPRGARAPPPGPAPRLDATDRMKGDVMRSWDLILQLGTAKVGEHLYRVFFEMLPEAMDSFPLHVRVKYQDYLLGGPEADRDLHNSPALANLFAKVINAIGCTVAGLQESDKLVPLLTNLGMRHISYRVREEFWPVLSKAMNITLRDLLGEAFTQEVENAWNIVYGFMSQIMIQGLRRAIELSQETKSSAGGSVASHGGDPVEQLRLAGVEDIDFEVKGQEEGRRTLSVSTTDEVWPRPVNE